MKKIILASASVAFTIFLSACSSANLPFHTGTVSSGANVESGYTLSTGAIADGDIVRVDYTGKFQSGSVFDTSDEAAAKKAGTYSTGRTYEPLRFTV